MKILFVNRSPKYGGFSVEELFFTIQEVLKRNNIQIENYYYNNDVSIYKNLKEIKQIPCDIIHITSGLPQIIRFLSVKKTIFTVHDINRYLNDLKGLKKLLYRYYYLVPLKKLNFITVISESVKQELISALKIDPNKIHVIHNCYPETFKYTPKEFNAENPRILQIGTKSWKNISRLIEAITGLKCTLIIIGKLTKKDEELLLQKNISYENYYNITSNEIYLQYQQCDILSFVSLYEGFGMPIIEAQAVGRIVLTSTISSMPEVSNNSTCMVNPYDITDIKKGFEKIITDENYRSTLLKKSLVNLERFSPTFIGGEYLKLYNKVLKNK